jgi:hypothetical protein
VLLDHDHKALLVVEADGLLQNRENAPAFRFERELILLQQEVCFQDLGHAEQKLVVASGRLTCLARVRMPADIQWLLAGHWRVEIQTRQERLILAEIRLPAGVVCAHLLADGRD